MSVKDWERLYQYLRLDQFRSRKNGIFPVIHKNPLLMLKFFYYCKYIYSSYSNEHEILFILTKMQKAYETMLRQNIFLFSLLAVSPLHLRPYNCMIFPQGCKLCKLLPQ